MLSKRSFGIVVVESVLSNYNGNPDEDNSPRTIFGETGLITDVCHKHRIREMIEDHDSPIWMHFKELLGLDDESFYIWESPLKGYPVKKEKEAQKYWEELLKNEGEEGFIRRFWDIRVFGATALGKNKEKTDDVDKKKKDKKKKNEEDIAIKFTRTGCISVSPMISIKPVEIICQTITKGNPLREELIEQQQGDIAPLAFKVARHAIFVGTYVINPSRAHYTKTTEKDIELFKALLPHAMSNSTSACRSGMKTVQVIHANHDNIIGSFNESSFFQFCRPTVKNPEAPSISMDDYNFISEDQIRSKFPDIDVDMIVDLSNNTENAVYK